MNLNEAISKLMDLQRQLTVWNSMSNLIIHDASTAAPRSFADIRREMLAAVGEQRYALGCGKETGELLDFLEAHAEELDARQRRMCEKLRRAYNRVRAIPEALYLRFERVKSDADAVWHVAKVNNDFATFAPYIDAQVEAMREIAAYAAPGMDPYDYWLDNFQEGMSRAICDPFFARMSESLPPLIQRAAARSAEHASLTGFYPVEQQREMARMLMGLLGIDEAQCSLCETEHPYTSQMTCGCVRMTTHYYEENFTRAMLTILHEGGHALYDLHVPQAEAFTVLSDVDAAAVHEGQSRFFENYVGRSRPFLGAILPKLRRLFPTLEGVSEEAFYAAVNACRPSFSRMAADEVTYPLHIIVRYELEKRLFDGELKAADLPEAWNAMYRTLLGVEVPDDARGVLQDSHWATGLFGYFPSYALGSAYGAQFLARMRETIDVDDCLARANLAPLRGWLEEKIWRFGSALKPNEVLQNAFGGPFDPQYYIDYLTQKMQALDESHDQ